MPDNRGAIVKILRSTDPDRRVVIVRRSDGLFAIRPENWRTFVVKTAPPRWVPATWASGIFATIELAEKEARFDYKWLSPDIPEEV